MKKLISLFLIISFSISVYSQWTGYQEQEFMKACKAEMKKNFSEGLSHSFCECVLMKIRLSYYDNPDRGDFTGEEMSQMASECMWPDDYKAQWYNDCLEVANSVDYIEDKGAYCDCFIEKMMIQYPGMDMAEDAEQNVISRFLSDCASHIPVNPQDPTKAYEVTDWSLDDYNKYMKECQDKRIDVSLGTATEICDCVYYKLLKRYKSYKEFKEKCYQTEYEEYHEWCTNPNNR